MHARDIDRTDKPKPGEGTAAQRVQPSREEQAKLEIGRTEITRPAAAFVATVFLALTVAVPVVQHVQGWREWRATGAAPSLAFYSQFEGVAGVMSEKWFGASTVLKRFLAANSALLKRIDAFQRELDDTCVLTRLTVSPVQSLLCRVGAGNEKTFVGSDGWLFYEPDVRYVTAPGFLDPEQLRRRAQGGNEYRPAPQPDPVAGIVAFRDQLRERRIELVVVPAPSKATVHPEAFTARLRGCGVAVQNASYAECVRRLQEAGVHVFDPAPGLVARRAAGAAQYLATDTHWRPEAMQEAARALAAFIRERRLLPTENRPAASGPYRASRSTVTNLGDIAVMLKLPAGQRLYPPETVTMEPVRSPDGAAWLPAGDADVLLLGDSFANIYSLGAMGWGEGGGLAEHLSLELGRPLDRIVRNDAGACASRELLSADLARGRDRLLGKKLVVWEFAARELAIGDWKRVDLRLGQPRHAGPPVLTAAPDAAVRVTGLVTGVSERPEKGAVYKDFIMKLYVTDMVTADAQVFAGGDGVIHVFGMRNREVLPVAAVQPGATVTVNLQPWERVESKYGSLKAGALEDVTLEIDKPLYWGELAAEGR